MKIPDKEYLVLLAQMSASIMAGACRAAPDDPHLHSLTDDIAHCAIQEAVIVLDLLQILPQTPVVLPPVPAIV